MGAIFNTSSGRAMGMSPIGTNGREWIARMAVVVIVVVVVVVFIPMACP